MFKAILITTYSLSGCPAFVSFKALSFPHYLEHGLIKPVPYNCDILAEIIPIFVVN